MATTKKFLDEDGVVQLVGKIKKAVNDANYTHGVTDIAGTTTAPTIANDLNATANARSATFTVNGGSDTFPYYDTTYGDASTTKDGLMTHEDKTKLDGIATGAEVNVQSDWNQTTTTADDYIKNKPAVNKVKQTVKTDNKSYNILMTDISTSATDDEVEYSEQVVHNPSKRSTTFHTNVGQSSVDVTVESGGVSFGSSSNKIDATSYTGRALGTETELLAELADGGAESGGTNSGASLVGYYDTVEDEETTVAEYLDYLTGAIGGSGSTSIASQIEALREGSNLVEGSNVTITPDTTNHQVTIAAADEKVSQTSDTTTSSAIPLLLASGATPTSPAGAKYNSSLGFTPSTSTLKIGTGTLTATDYSGTAAKATADGSGNNIVNTYATKAALDALSNKWTGQFKIASSAEATAIAGKDASGLELGYIYLVADSSASSPNVYDEYIKVALGTSPETYSVEKIGTTDAGVDVVSLTTSEINTIWSTTAAAS